MFSAIVQRGLLKERGNPRNPVACVHCIILLAHIYQMCTCMYIVHTYQCMYMYTVYVAVYITFTIHWLGQFYCSMELLQTPQVSLIQRLCNTRLQARCKNTCSNVRWEKCPLLNNSFTLNWDSNHYIIGPTLTCTSGVGNKLSYWSK